MIFGQGAAKIARIACAPARKRRVTPVGVAGRCHRWLLHGMDCIGARARFRLASARSEDAGSPLDGQVMAARWRSPLKCLSTPPIICLASGMPRTIGRRSWQAGTRRFPMVTHDAQKVRSFEHPGVGRRRAKATPKGRQIDPTAAARDRAAARRPAAAARSPDRISAPDPGQVSPDFRGPSRSACRRDEAVVCRGVRDRDLLCAFRHVVKEGEPDIAPLTIRVCDLADLRDAGRGKAAA